MCTNISIVDDLVVEDTEFFTVLLESTNNAIINGSAEVDIVDDDGELKFIPSCICQNFGIDNNM